MSPRSNLDVSHLKFHHARLFFVRGLVVLLFVLLTGRLVYVQGFLKAELSGKAYRQISHKPADFSLRRNIVDRNREVLAETVPISSCFVDPTMVKDKARVVKELSRYLGIPPEAIKERLKQARRSFVWIKRNVSAAEAKAVKDARLTGVSFKSEFRRNYPLGHIASRLLGMVGVDGSGLSGIEKDYNGVLHSGGDFDDHDQADRLPPGEVQLTIDSFIQKVAEQELDWGAKKVGAKKGMALVQNPHTGDILAMADWPPLSLDPDQKVDPKELRVPALIDVFEPGSTFKIVTIGAAIEEKIFSSGRIFDGEKGAWKVMDITIHDHEPRPKMSFEEILIYSSNVGTAKVGDALGTSRLYQYARLFGFGVFPGSGLSGETKGVLRTPSRWSGVSKYVVAFGQEIGVTAIQMVGAYSAVANGGVLMEPKVLKSVLSETGEPLWTNSPTPVRRVVSPETAKKLTDNLVRAVREGTGLNAQIQWAPDCHVAGKTGTAQIFDFENRRYDKERTIVSFCGFFPAQRPRYTILVLLDEPEGRRWGGLDAAPIFRRIAEQIYQDGKGRI